MSCDEAPRFLDVQEQPNFSEGYFSVVTTILQPADFHFWFERQDKLKHEDLKTSFERTNGALKEDDVLNKSSEVIFFTQNDCSNEGHSPSQNPSKDSNKRFQKSKRKLLEKEVKLSPAQDHPSKQPKIQLSSLAPTSPRDKS